MRSALIGYTGFIGSNILRQKTISDLYNSKNIDDIQSKQYDLLICAGAPGVKWKANKDPDTDLASINKLIKNLSSVKARKFVLISTIDVYDSPNKANENTKIKDNLLHPYGKHRLVLEKFVTENFPNHLIVRLPGLFGIGIKKNFIYDLIQNNNLELTDKKGKFQFYNLNNLWKDLEIAKKHNINLINFATEPVTAKEIAVSIGNKDFNTKTNKDPANYNVQTLYAHVYHQSGNYLYKKKEILEQIKKFIIKETNNYEIGHL